MAIRLKTKWHSSRRRRSKGPKTLEDRAGVIGFNIWKIAFGAFQHMESEEFRFGSDAQIMAVVEEFIALLVQVVDRLVYGKLPERDRSELMSALGQHLAGTVESNMHDLAGAGDHRERFLALLNARNAEYGRFDFPGGDPGYGAGRYLGQRVAVVMAESGEKWVLEHVMEIELPGALKLLRRVVGESLGIDVSH